MNMVILAFLGLILLIGINAMITALIVLFILKNAGIHKRPLSNEDTIEILANRKLKELQQQYGRVKMVRIGVVKDGDGISYIYQYKYNIPTIVKFVFDK